MCPRWVSTPTKDSTTGRRFDSEVCESEIRVPAIVVTLLFIYSHVRGDRTFLEGVTTEVTRGTAAGTFCGSECGGSAWDSCSGGGGGGEGLNGAGGGVDHLEEGKFCKRRTHEGNSLRRLGTNGINTPMVRVDGTPA